MTGGAVAKLFFRSSPLEAAYSISQYDFHVFSLAVASIPDLVKSRVDKEAGFIILSGAINSKEREFWNCIKNAH